MRGHLSVQKQALTQGMAQADLHPLLSRHTSHFSNSGVMLEFVVSEKSRRSWSRGGAYAQSEQQTLVDGFVDVFTMQMRPKV